MTPPWHEGWPTILIACAALYFVAELQNRWLAIAFALVGFVWLLRSLRIQAGAEDPVRPSKGKVSSGI